MTVLWQRGFITHMVPAFVQHMRLSRCSSWFWHRILSAVFLHEFYPVTRFHWEDFHFLWTRGRGQPKNMQSLVLPPMLGVKDNGLVRNSLFHMYQANFESLSSNKRCFVLWYYHESGGRFILWMGKLQHFHRPKLPIDLKVGCLLVRICLCRDGYVLLYSCRGSMLSWYISVRPLLIDDPEFIFPLSLQQVALYRSMDGRSKSHSKRARDQMKVCHFAGYNRHLWVLIEPVFRFFGSWLWALLCGNSYQNISFPLWHHWLRCAGLLVVTILSTLLELAVVAWVCWI